MPYRVTTYQQAFEDVLGLKFGEKLQNFVNLLEKDGHSERSIAFSIWRSRHKLLALKGDPRFINVLKNEVEKWSWKKGDPRWREYWNRKKQAEEAKRIRKEIDSINADDNEIANINKRAKGKSDEKGYVYFIQGQCGGAIKVGYSVNPENRLKELQTGYPDTLVMLLVIPGTQRTEHTFHRMFEGSRLRGEWFRPDKCVIDKIKELKAKYYKVLPAWVKDEYAKAGRK